MVQIQQSQYLKLSNVDSESNSGQDDRFQYFLISLRNSLALFCVHLSNKAQKAGL